MKKYSKRDQDIRKARFVRFKKTTLQLLGLDYDVYAGPKNTYMYWFIHDKYGKVVIYPKSNKLHCEFGGWDDDAVEFLNSYVIKEK